DAAFPVGGHAIRISPLVLEANEFTLAGELTISREIEGVDDPPGAVGMVEDRPVWTERGAIGHSVAIVQPGPSQIRVQTVQRATILLVAIVLGPRPDTAGTVDLGIVQTVERAIGLRVADRGDTE